MPPFLGWSSITGFPPEKRNFAAYRGRQRRTTAIASLMPDPRRRTPAGLSRSVRVAALSLTVPLTPGLRDDQASCKTAPALAAQVRAVALAGALIDVGAATRR